MNVREKIIKAVLPEAGKYTVTDVRIGLGYTAVQLNTGQVGLAFTFHKDIKGGCDVLKGMGSLIGRRASDMISHLDSPDKIKTALALATVNALPNSNDKTLIPGNALKQIPMDPSDHVGMVGHFVPVVALVREKCASLTIFERIDFPTGNLLPDKEIPNILPDCQVALISSTTIINGTLDAILDAAANCREVVLLGASTPLLARAFDNTPVTLLSGVVVNQPAEILSMVSQGGGMGSFKNYITKVNQRVGSVGSK
jgi:uncharacterized protein (DUF4213/DUF364 family)